MRLLLVLLLLWVWTPVLADAPVEGRADPADRPRAGDYTVLLIDGSGALRGVARTADTSAKLPDAGADEDEQAEAMLRLAVEATIRGPSVEDRLRGFRPALPEGTKLDEVRVRGDQGGSFITLPAGYLEDFTAEKAQFLSDVFRKLDFNVSRIRNHVLMIRDPVDGGHYPLPHFLPTPAPVPAKPGESKLQDQKGVGQPPLPGQGQPSGYLSGKSIIVNPGHGWYYSDSLKRWATQRGNTHNIIEDHTNSEAVDTYLIHYLWNAGAGVYTCRERDMNVNRVVVDDAGPGVTSTGGWVLDGGSGFGGTSLRVAASPTETATATFTPLIPEDGYYHVSVWYEGGLVNASDVKITVRHTGGETVWNQNMKRDGYTWRYIGRYYFRAGSSASAGSVVISNASSDVGFDVVADAIRFGGGTGEETPFGEILASGWPRWEEAGAYHANYMGCTSGVCGSSTVTAMPRYAKWESEAWEDSVYISWHSNAFDGTARGTTSFAYASGGWDAPFDGVPGSLELRNLVHDELVNDLGVWQGSTWPDLGLHTNWYGEINPSYNDEMPGALFEMAFHDSPHDARYLQDPTFRQAAARAVYQGIVRYFADRDGDPSYTLLPEPPTNLSVTNDGSGGVILAWDAPPYDTGDGYFGDDATGYRVYRSPDGLGFENGVDVAGAENTIYTDAAISPGETLYYRVTSTNAGGESLPTETLAVRVTTGWPRILVVSGFDRMDDGLGVITDDPYSTSDLQRGYVDMMNSYRYTVNYAEALESAGVAFDSTSNEAVIADDVFLGWYDAVIWYCGEESTADSTFDPAEQSLMESYLDGGGSLFVSGSEIGWDLDLNGNGVAFYSGYLMAGLASDDANTYDVTPTAGGIFEGNASFSFDDNTYGEYDAEWPDVLDPLGGASVCLGYDGGAGGNAGIQYDGPVHKVVNFGFPFETVVSESARTEIMADVLDFFDVGYRSPPPVPGGLPDWPMTADRVDVAGSTIELWWDTFTCPAPGYHLIHGDLDGVGSYMVDGAACDLDTWGTYTWSEVPPGSSWFIVISTDGTGTEGSWGSATAGTRNWGLPSGECSIVARDDSGTCP